MLPILDIWKAKWHAKDVLPPAVSLFPKSWQAIAANWETFGELIAIPFAILMAGVGAVLIMHGHRLQAPVDAVSGLIIFAGIALYFFTLPALIYAQLRSAQGVTLTYKEALASGVRFALRLWSLVLVTYVLTLIGLLLLVVPGLFILRRYLLAPYFLMDGDINVLAAMRQSAMQSAKYSPSIWELLGMYAIFLAIGRFVPFVGSLLAVLLFAAYSCAAALRYEQIKTYEAAKAERKQVRNEARKETKNTQRRSKKKS